MAGDADIIKEFLVVLGFQVDEAEFKKFRGGLEAATKVAVGMSAAIVGAAGAVTAWVSHLAEGLDRTADLANRTNTSADAIMRLGYVASLTDSSVAAVESSIDGLTRTAGEAARGIGRGAAIFDKLGLSAKKANGEIKTTPELLDEIGASIRGLSRQEQVATLSKLGIDSTLVQALTEDVSALGAEFDAVYGALGVDLEAAMQEASDFQDALGRMQFALGAIAKAVAVRLMPQIRRGFDTARQAIVANLPRIVQAVTPILDLVLRIAGAVVQLGSRVAEAAGAIIGWFGRLNDATDGWAGYILAAAAAWRYLNLAFLASPVGIVLSLVTAVGLLIDDFLTWKEGGDSLIDWGSTFGRTLQALVIAVGGLGAAFLVVKGALLAWAAANAAWTAAQGIATLAMWAFNAAVLANPFGLAVAGLFAIIAAVPLVLANLDTIRGWFTSALDWITSWGDTVGDVLSGVAEFFGFGGGAVPAGARPPGPSLTPGPAQAAALRGSEVRVEQKTEIRVDGSGDPEAVGRAVARQQRGVSADLTRNLAGAVR